MKKQDQMNEKSVLLLIEGVKQNIREQREFLLVLPEIEACPSPFEVPNIPGVKGAMIASHAATCIVADVPSIYVAADAWFRSVDEEQAKKEQSENGECIRPSDLPLDDRQSAIFIFHFDIATKKATGRLYSYKTGNGPDTLERMDMDSDDAQGMIIDALREGVEMGHKVRDLVKGAK
jgi:hypothetical protein